MKGNISLRGTRERPEQSGVTETESHADEQCFLFAHICIRKGGAAGRQFHQLAGEWRGALNLLKRGWEVVRL